MQEDEEKSRHLRKLVEFYRKDIVKDLDVDHVVPYLVEALILSYDDKQLIDKEPTQRQRAERMLEILIIKATDNFLVLPAFKDTLKKKYGWLYNKLCEDVIDHRVVPESEVKSNGSSYKNPSEIAGVPCLPTVNIERKDLLNDVVSKLWALKQNQYLVIQGMAGCGKSVLATQAVHKLISERKNDEGRVNWLSIGKECSDSNDVLLAKMRILCDKLDVNRAPKSVEQGKEILRDAFVTRPLDLLVLDNVWSHRVIRNFDVGCRIMVTTQDMSVMDVVNGRLASCIRVAEGFQEPESLKFFCEALNIPGTESLPAQAKMIHAECKGSPMVISLIASLLDDHRTCETEDADRWTHYYESLSKRKFSAIRRDRSYEHPSIFDAICLSFDNLDNKYKEYYQDFGLFQDDVEIPCQVLQTLWTKKKHEAEDIMKTLVKKSMATEQYDAVQKSYVYYVHDLQLDFLKYRLVRGGSQMEKNLHLKFVEMYEAKCNSEFHNLPDDGYIHFHIGYHIFKAGRLDLFPRIYLDLKFIGEKLRITGPADVLVDFRKYGTYIVDGNEQNQEILEELETFTQQVGYKMYGHPDIDIIQMAIQLPKHPLLSKQARNLALSLPNRVYIEWSNSNSTQWKNAESTVICGDTVCSAKFVGCQGNLFVVALNNGDIKLCDFTSSAVHHIFKGHRDAVNCIAVFCQEILYQPLRNGHIHRRTQDYIMVSASSDQTCKLWDLTPFLQKFEKSEDSNVEDYNQELSPSPKLRPHNKSWNFDTQIDDSLLSLEFHTAPVSFVEFSFDGSQVMSTSKNELLCWKVANGTILFKFSSVELNSCHFPLKQSDFILATTDTEILAISSQRPTYYGIIHAHFLKIVALLFRSRDSFCTVSENEISLWKIYVRPVPDKPQRLRVSPRNSVPLVNGASGDATNSNKSNVGGSLGNFLHPDDYTGSNEKPRSNRSSNGDIGGSFKLRSGRTSPTSISDTTDSSSTQIEVGGNVVHIIIEQSISKDKGLFHSAALDSHYGGGDLLVCGTYDHKIVLLQLDKLIFLGEFAAHNGPVTAVCFSPVDEFSLLSASVDQTAKVWDVATEEKEETESKRTGVFSSLPPEDHIFPTRPDFISLCATDRRSLQVYHGCNLVEESQSLSSGITAVAVFKDGTQAAVGTDDGQVFWVTGIDQCQRNIEAEGDKDDKKANSTVKLELIGNHESTVIFSQFGYYDNVLATGSCNTILIFRDFQPHWRLPLSHDWSLIGLHFCFRDSTLVICGQNGYVGIKDINNKSNLEGHNTVEGPKIKFTCSSMNKESQKLVMGSEEGLICLFEVKKDVGIESVKMLQCKHSSFVRSLALSLGAEKLAVGHDNGLITIWDVSTDPYKEDQDLILHKSPVEQLMFSRRNFGDAPWLLSCGDQFALWSFEKSAEKMKITFMQDRRRRRSGEGSRPSSRLSMEIPADVKVGRKGKRELLQTFSFYGNTAHHVSCDLGFSRFVTVDDCGVFYILDIM